MKLESILLPYLGFLTTGTLSASSISGIPSANVSKCVIYCFSRRSADMNLGFSRIPRESQISRSRSLSILQPLYQLSRNCLIVPSLPKALEYNRRFGHRLSVSDVYTKSTAIGPTNYQLPFLSVVDCRMSVSSSLQSILHFHFLTQKVQISVRPQIGLAHYT